jgi:hypothetical protein
MNKQKSADTCSPLLLHIVLMVFYQRFMGLMEKEYCYRYVKDGPTSVIYLYEVSTILKNDDHSYCLLHAKLPILPDGEGIFR